MQNRILTIFISDMQGYTTRQAQSTRDAMEQLLTQHRELVLPALRALGGRVVKSMGDAFLAAFESPTDAVLAAVQVQKSLRVRNLALKEARDAMYVRIAVSTGEVSIDDDGDVFGPPVNLAARLQTIAEPGAIYLSESTFLSMNQSEIAALEVGHRVLKGIPGEVKVYRIADDFIEQARLLTRAELDQATRSVGRAVSATRRNTTILLVLAALTLIAVSAMFFRRSNGPGDGRADEQEIRALVEAGNVPRAVTAARAAWLEHPSDLRLRDQWLDLARRELYLAAKNQTLDALYRERESDPGWFHDNIATHASELEQEPRFQWLLATWHMLNEPLAPDVPELVVKVVESNAADARRDPEFRALLQETVEYSVKDDAAHATYARALKLLE